MKLSFLFLLLLWCLSNLNSSEDTTRRQRRKETPKGFVSLLSDRNDCDSILNLQYRKIVMCFQNKKYDEGLKLALDLHRKNENGSTKVHYKITNLIAKFYEKNKNPEKAITFYKKTLNQLLRNEIARKNPAHNNDRELAENFLGIGTQYALINVKDSAVFYFKKLVKLNPISDRILELQASCYSNLVKIYQNDPVDSSHLQTAVEFAQKAIDIHKKRNDTLNLVCVMNNLANLYARQSDFKKSKEKYFEALSLIEKDTSIRAVSYKLSLYSNLASIISNLKEYDAYNELIPSIDPLENLQQLKKYKIHEYGTAQNNINTKLEEKELKRGREVKHNTLKMSWFKGTLGSLLVVLLLTFLLNQHKLRQRNLSLQLSKQKLLQQQKIEKIRSESQLKTLNATLDGKENERKKIAEMLHDNVGASLSSANLHLQACKKLFKSPIIPLELQKSQNIIYEVSQKIRHLSHTLVSSVLLKFGLAHEIRDIAEKYSNSELRIFCETVRISRYVQDFEIKLFNIVQELLNNVLKHSDATEAKIILVEKKKKLILSIQDNGKGFDKQAIMKKDGMGINQINARIQMMDGKFTIKSKKGQGTLINIELAIYEKGLINHPYEVL